MPSTYSSSLRLELMAQGENANTWGNKTNTNLDKVEQAIAGYQSVDIAGSSSVYLSVVNASATADSPGRNAFIVLTGALTSAISVIVPDAAKGYWVLNNATGASVTFRTSGGTGFNLPGGRWVFAIANGTTVVDTFQTGGYAYLTSVNTFTNLNTFTSALTVNTSVSVSGSMVITGQTDLRGSVSVSGTSTFRGPVVVSGASTFTSAVTFNTSVSVSGSIVVNGLAQFLGNVSVSGTFGVSGAAIFASAATFKTSVSVSGSFTVTGDANFTTAKFITAKENITVVATAATGTINFDVLTQPILYYTGNATGNWTINFRGSNSVQLNTLMAINESITVAFLATQGTSAYFSSAVQVDGTSVTARWQGGLSPTAGNASSVDSYTYTIIKTGTSAYTVLAAQTQFK